MSKDYGNIKQFFLVGCTVLALAPMAARAQQAETLKAGSVVRGVMTPMDGVTLAYGNMAVRLIGVQVPRTAGDANAQALAVMQKLVGKAESSCRLTDGAAKVEGRFQVFNAVCQTAAGDDLATALLSQGVVVSTAIPGDTSGLQDRYTAAEEQARAQGLGVWKQATPAQNGVTASGAVPQKMSPLDPAQQRLSGAVAVIDAPLVKLVFMLGVGVWLILLTISQRLGIGRLRRDVSKIQSVLQTRDKRMQDRERFVIASALEGELTTNRAKLDAFLIIYEELLKSLRDPTRKPKYQKAGDVIHERPSLIRAVYDANVEKMDILGVALSHDLKKIYNEIETEPDYKTIEPEHPLPAVIALVEKILASAHALLEPMDKTITALGIVARDKRTSM